MAEFVVPPHQRDFRCRHCDGRILIPRELPSTTGPCPHCGGIITSPGESPPSPPVSAFQMPVVPANEVASPPVPPSAPIPATQSMPAPGSVPATPPPRPVPTLAEIPAPAQPPPAPPDSPPAPAPAPKLVKKGAAIELPPKKEVSERNKLKKHPTPVAPRPQRSGLIPAMLVLLALGLLGGAVVYFASREIEKSAEAPTPLPAGGEPGIKESNYIRVGWQQEALQVLRGYMAAASAKEKLPYVLNSSALAGKIEDFYGGGVIDDSDTPAEAFSIYELSEEDRRRGLFMMIYDQPPQFDMKEFFRPLASLEVQYGLDEADLLLSTLARVGNFAMEPLRVHAFFKKTPAGMKLDWEIFAQTKYRTLQNFVELPETNQTGVFRVFVVEDVPDKGRAIAGTRTYRVVDPANTTDNARVNVKVDSDIGRALSIINWRGTKENRPITRTATLELKWSGEPTAPELEISRFICWEFLGLGGQETALNK